MALLRLHVRFDQAANGIADALVKEHLKFGVGRRFNLIGFALRNIFQIFPPDRERNLGPQEVADVQINLHAFVINLSGCFDNMAWAFVLRHGLFAQIGAQTRVGMFHPVTRRFLPQAITTALDRPKAQEWQQKYLKDYRDALAHRIPLYLPPGALTPEEGDRYKALEHEKFEALSRADLNRVEYVEAEQARLGRPCFAFMHSFGPAQPSRPIEMHPQLVADTRTVIEFGAVFLDNWHARAP